jgi:hypothetical protein
VTRIEIISALRANVDGTVRLKFADGEEHCVTVVSVDDEGFVGKLVDDLFWTAFEDVADVSFEKR